jgi:hypothetical protein
MMGESGVRDLLMFRCHALTTISSQRLTAVSLGILTLWIYMCTLYS